MTKETITISKEEYARLIGDSDFLQCLQGAGVDNWEGYDYAQEAYEEMHPEDAEEN